MQSHNRSRTSRSSDPDKNEEVNRKFVCVTKCLQILTTDNGNITVFVYL
jgi:hypothetical protein